MERRGCSFGQAKRPRGPQVSRKAQQASVTQFGVTKVPFHLAKCVKLERRAGGPYWRVGGIGRATRLEHWAWGGAHPFFARSLNGARAFGGHAKLGLRADRRQKQRVPGAGGARAANCSESARDSSPPPDDRPDFGDYSSFRAGQRHQTGGGKPAGWPPATSPAPRPPLAPAIVCWPPRDIQDPPDCKGSSGARHFIRNCAILDPAQRTLIVGRPSGAPDSH